MAAAICRRSSAARAVPLGRCRKNRSVTGQTVVIQPNVVTRDGKAGVQTGEMVVITKSGIERLHAIPRGFVQL